MASSPWSSRRTTCGRVSTRSTSRTSAGDDGGKVLRQAIDNVRSMGRYPAGSSPAPRSITSALLRKRGKVGPALRYSTSRSHFLTGMSRSCITTKALHRLTKPLTQRADECGIEARWNQHYSSHPERMPDPARFLRRSSRSSPRVILHSKSSPSMMAAQTASPPKCCGPWPRRSRISRSSAFARNMVNRPPSMPAFDTLPAIWW